MSKAMKRKTLKNRKVIIPVAAAVVIIAVFTGLLLFTGIFHSRTNNGSGDLENTVPPGQVTEDPHQSTTPPTGSAEPGSGIPGEGGQLRITGNTEVEFTPGETGIWEFRTSDNGGSDPILFLMDAFGEVLLYDDNSAGDLNAVIVAMLEAGTKYIIETRIYANAGDGSGSCTLTVSPEPLPVVDAPPISAGSVRVTGESWFTFTPDRSGVWEIKTSGAGDSDPYLELLDDNENNVAYDDNSGVGLNALISARLEAGAPYIIKVNFYSTGSQSCTLTVSPGGTGR